MIFAVSEVVCRQHLFPVLTTNNTRYIIVVLCTIIHKISLNDEERSQDVTCPEILAVYCDILGRDDLTIADNFFRCGGDSIKAIRLLYELNDRTGTLLQLADIFEFPVIYDMQNHIAAVKK